MDPDHEPITLNSSNQWTDTWSGLNKFEDGEEIEYTVDETALPSGYSKDIRKVRADEYRRVRRGLEMFRKEVKNL